MHYFTLLGIKLAHVSVIDRIGHQSAEGNLVSRFTQQAGGCFDGCA